MVELMGMWPGLTVSDFWGLTGLELMVFREATEARKQQE